MLVIALLAAGVAAGGLSLGVQRRQTQRAATQQAEVLTGGHAAVGRALFVEKGCGACHTITGRMSATGEVGPPLSKVATMAFLAGKVPNEPQYMIAWIQHPQTLNPGVGMPEMGLSDAEARDLAAYLYSQG